MGSRPRRWSRIILLQNAGMVVHDIFNGGRIIKYNRRTWINSYSIKIPLSSENIESMYVPNIMCSIVKSYQGKVVIVISLCTVQIVMYCSYRCIYRHSVSQSSHLPQINTLAFVYLFAKSCSRDIQFSSDHKSKTHESCDQDEEEKYHCHNQTR